MSNLLLPVMFGLAWPVTRAPVRSTAVKRSTSLNERRAQLAVAPLWEYTIVVNVLGSNLARPGGAADNSFLSILDFFNTVGGQYDNWLFNDTYTPDNAAAAAQFGIGDNSTTAFQLVRALVASGFVEPVANLNGSPSIFRNDWQGNQLMYSTARTNECLWGRDLTNAAWTKASVTAAKDQTGADGLATSASSIVSTAGNGTVKQTIASASNVARRFSVWMKRITGVGEIDITMDNGATWTRVDGSINSGTYTRVAMGQTLANPTVGFRIVANGDKVAVDYCQEEIGSVDTSSIATTTPAVTVTDYAVSAVGVVTFATAPLAAAVLTWTGSYYVRCRWLADQYDFDIIMSGRAAAKKLQFVGSLGTKI